MSLVNRVANKIRTRADLLGLPPFDECKMATSALATIRNPSPAMIAAGAKKVRGGSASDCAAATWRAMWDEMMKEGEISP